MSSYIPSTGPRDAKIVILHETPGMGRMAENLLNETLARNGINPRECFHTYVTHYRPPEDNIFNFIKFKRTGVEANDFVKDGWRELFADLNHIQPNVVVPIGNIALWTLTGKQQISKRRGSILVSNPPGILREYDDVNFTDGSVKVIPTIHPETVISQFTLKTIFNFDFKRIAEEAKTPDINLPVRTFYMAAEEIIGADTSKLKDNIVYVDEAETMLLVDKLLASDELSVDIETPTGNLYCVGFASDPSWGLVLRVDTEWKNNLIRQLLESNVPKIFQNGLFDCSFLAKFEGQRVVNYAYDTMYAQHAIYPESSGGAVDEWKKRKNNPGMRLGLDFLCSIYTREPYYKDEGKNQDLTITDNIAEYLAYNAKDCCITLEVAQGQKAGLKPHATAFQTTMQQTPAIIDMMAHGIRFDKEKLDEFTEYYNKHKIAQQNELDQRASNKMGEMLQVETDPERRAKLIEYLTIMAGRKSLGHHLIDTSSSKQMAGFLYDICNFKEKKKKNARGIMTVTTDEEAIKELYGETKDPMLLTIIEIRRADKLLENYLNIKLDTKDYTYFSVNPVGTKTSRWSVSKTIHGYGLNMTTIPRPNPFRMAKGHPNLRELVICDPGYVLGYFDLAQVEDRIVSYLAGIERKIHAFENDIDAHSLTASLIFGKDISEIGKKSVERYLGKQSNHAFNYGEGPGTFTKKINKNADETNIWVNFNLSKGIRTAHLAAYPEIEGVYWPSIRTALRKSRTLENPFGRKRFFFDRLNDSTERDGYSWIPQSTAPDIINRGMINVHNALRSHDVRVLLQVHDAILVQIPEDGAEQIAEEIIRLMTVPVPMPHIQREIIIPVDYKLGPNWGDLG